MAITQLNPYLNFSGDCQQAIFHYERVLGAKVERAMHFSDMPGGSVAHGNLVMHATLVIGAFKLMLSDAQPGTVVPKQSNQYVCLNLDDEAEAATMFAALADGGTVTMPFQDTFWGAKFGMLVDRFGIQWMVNADKPKS
jgi:PhnB protein